MKNFLFFLGTTLALVLSAPTANAQGVTPGGQYTTPYGEWKFYDTSTFDTTCTASFNYILDFAPDSSVVDTANIWGYTEIFADQSFIYVDAVLHVSYDSVDGEFSFRDTIALPVCTPFEARSVRISGDVNHDGTATVYLTMEEDDQNSQVILDQDGRDGWFARDWQYSRTLESELVGATYTFLVQPASNGTFRFRGRVVDDYGNKYVSENVIELTFTNVSDQYRVADNGSTPRLIHASEDTSLAGWPVINTMGQRVGVTGTDGSLPASTLPGIYFVDTPGQRVQLVKRE